MLRINHILKHLLSLESVKNTGAITSCSCGGEDIVVYIHQTSIRGSPDENEKSLILKQVKANGSSVTIVFEEPPVYHLLVSGTPKEHLVAHPNLKAVLTPWSGVIPKTKKLVLKYGLEAYNIHHNSNATAEMAVALVLAAAKKIVRAHNDLTQTKWTLRTKIDHSLLLENKRALVLGFGAIGKRVARVLHALEMEVHCIRRTVRKVIDNGLYMHTLDEFDILIKESHVIVIALPGTKDTYGLFDEEKLLSLPSKCILVNVGRAKIIDEQALYQTLLSRPDIRFSCDVWYKYPKMGHHPDSKVAPSRYPIHELPNVTLSPHRGGQVGETMHQRGKSIADFIIAFASGGKLPNKVDLQKGY